MKKLFGRDKPKAAKAVEESPINIPTPIHQQHAVYQEDWEVLSDKGRIRRSESFVSLAGSRKQPQQPQQVNGGPIAALGILRALDSHGEQLLQHQPKTRSEEKLITNSGDSIYRGSDSGHGDRKKQPFWTARPHDIGDDLTKLIGYLTATASEDWSLVLEVCERASMSDSNAKEAVRALRREFKYGEPSAQLSAARLWAIMLRNSTETFISQSTSRKFLDTLEDLLLNPRTSPVVRERVMDVVSAAAYASGSKKDTGFRGLWRKVKPPNKPDEGVPFDTDDAMFNPPVSSRLSAHEVPALTFQDPTPITPESGMPFTPQPVLQQQQQQQQAVHHPKEHKDKDKEGRRRKSPSRHNRIIPPEEDIRRLFQECKIGQGNASLLSQALSMCRPEDLEDPKKGGRGGVIKEFYAKCLSSQELICAQIEWATAGAERSRALKDTERGKDRTESGDVPPAEPTVEESLLAALLAANADLLEALGQYDDLERVGMERKVEDRSRKEIKIDRRLLNEDASPETTSVGSHSREPSPTPSYQARAKQRRPNSVLVAPTPMYAGGAISVNTTALGADLSTSLAPPPAAPAGPRSPAQTSLGGSRTPSPATPSLDSTHGSEGYHERARQDTFNGLNGQQLDYDDYHHIEREDLSDEEEYNEPTPLKPSAKALGKMKVVEKEEESAVADTDDLFYSKDDSYSISDYGHHPSGHDSDDSSSDGRWHRHYQPVHFVYDAVAERTQQRLKQGHENLPVNGIH